MFDCLFVSGKCDHEVCSEYPVYQPAPYPTEEDYCSGGGHGYYGDDSGIGRCYCGTKEYPLGGPHGEDD